MARNRKRAKERRARRPQPVATARTEREDAAPDPISHATPDVELAEAQLAVGRGELEEEPALDEELEPDGAEPGLEPELEGEVTASDGTPAAEAPALPARRAPSGSRLINFVQGSWRELQRVQWPDRRQVIQATGVVIGFVIVAGVYLGVADWVAGKIVSFIIK